MIESTQAGITSTPFNFAVNFVCGPLTALALAATGPLTYTIGTGPTSTAWPAATPTPSCAVPNLTYSVAESPVWLTAAADFTIESADTALVGTSATLTITATDGNTSVDSPPLIVEVQFVCSITSITVDVGAAVSTSYTLASGVVVVPFPTFVIAPASCPDAQTVSIVSPADLSTLPWLTLVAGGF